MSSFTSFIPGYTTLLSFASLCSCQVHYPSAPSCYNPPVITQCSIYNIGVLLMMSPCVQLPVCLFVFNTTVVFSWRFSPVFFFLPPCFHLAPEHARGEASELLEWSESYDLYITARPCCVCGSGDGAVMLTTTTTTTTIVPGRGSRSGYSWQAGGKMRREGWC